MGLPTGPNWIQELGAFFAGLHDDVSVGEPLVALVSRVYTRVSVQPEYAAKLQSVFNASIEPLRSEAEINTFVSETTRGMIDELVTSEQVSQSVLIAVNALYFKGKWSECFSPADTRVAAFYNPAAAEPIKCHMMQSPAGKMWSYHEDATSQYILLPYSGEISGTECVAYEAASGRA